MNNCNKTLCKQIPIILLVAALVCILDQWSKAVILQRVAHGELIPIIPDFFNITLTFNYGAAFGLWTWLPEPWRIVALIVSTSIALLAVGYFLLHEHFKSKISQLALAFILGGAVGNVIDRLRLGAVVDFLDFYFGNYHWPAFNVADSAICVGVFSLILFGSKKTAKETVTPEAPITT